MRSLRILVADDEFHICEGLRISLSQLGHAVTSARSGVEALQALHHATFDAVVTDILMPGKDGLQLIEELRTKWPAMTVVAVSGGGRIGTEQLLAAASGMGADAVLAKPFRFSQLTDILADLLPCG